MLDDDGADASEDARDDGDTETNYADLHLALDRFLVTNDSRKHMLDFNVQFDGPDSDHRAISIFVFAITSPSPQLTNQARESQVFLMSACPQALHVYVTIRPLKGLRNLAMMCA